MTNRKHRVALCMCRPLDLVAYGCLIELVTHSRITIRCDAPESFIRRAIGSRSKLIVMDDESLNALNGELTGEYLQQHDVRAVVIAHRPDPLPITAPADSVEVVRSTSELVRALRADPLCRVDEAATLPASVPPKITPREREVWLMIATGESVAEVASELGLAESTVDSHKSKLMKKLNVRKSVDLARLAIRLGLVEV